MSKKTKIFLIIFFACLTLSLIVSVSSTSSPKTSKTFLSGYSKQVGVVKISDIILESDDIVKEINAFRDDYKTVAVLLRIDSPGGAVAPSQEIYQAVKLCAVKKPTIVSMGSVAASGGYYIASGATRIFANGGTLTGSIGVIIEFPRYYELLKKIGVSIEVVTAGKLKDAGSPVREFTNYERMYFDRLLQDTHEQFIRDVATGRNMDYDYIKSLAEGQIFTGNQAFELGLIDTVGTLDDAKNFILQSCELPQSTNFYENINYKRFWKYLSSKSPVRNLLPFRRSGVYFISEQLI